MTFEDLQRVPLELRSSEYLSVIQNAAKAFELPAETIMNWLHQFGRDVHLVIPLLRHFRFVSRRDEKVLYDIVFRHIRRQEVGRFCLLALGPVGKSSPAIYNDFAKHVRIPLDRVFAYERLKDPAIADFESIVIVDDITVSGQTLSRLIPPIQEQWPEKKIMLCFFAGKNQPLANMAGDNSYIQYFLAEEIDDADTAFGRNVFPAPAMAHQARELCYRFGKDLEADMPLGYNDDELIFAFARHCPNNTLPIFWSTSPGWLPLLPTPQSKSSAKKRSSAAPVAGDSAASTELPVLSAAATAAGVALQETTPTLGPQQLDDGPRIAHSRSGDDIEELLDQFFEQLTLLEREVFCAVALSEIPLSPDDVADYWLPKRSSAEVAAVAKGWVDRRLLTKNAETLSFAEPLAREARDLALGVLSNELCEAQPEIAYGLSFTADRDMTFTPSRFGKRSFASRILSELTTRSSSQDQLKSRLLELLTREPASKRAVGPFDRNIVALLLGMESSGSGLILPSCRLHRIDLRESTTHDLDLSACDLFQPNFTSTLSNINAVCFSADGSQLVLGDSSGSLAVYRWQTNEFVAQLHRVHRQPIRGIVAMADSPGWYISCGEDGRVRLSNPEREATQLLAETPRRCWAMAPADGGALVAVATDTGDLLLFDAKGKTGAQRDPIPVSGHGLGALAWDPISRTFIAGDDGGSVYRIAPESGAVMTLCRLDRKITALTVIAGDHIIIGTHDERIFDLLTTGDNGLVEFTKIHTAEIKVLMSLDDGAFFSGGRDGIVASWQVGIKDPATVLQGVPPVIRGAAVSGARHFAICAEERAFVFKRDKLRKLAEIRGNLQEAWAIAFQPNSDCVYGGFENGELHRISLAGEQVSVTRAHDRRIRSISISPTGNRIATGSSDRQVTIWSYENGAIRKHTRVPHRYPWLRAMAFRDDGRFLVFGAGDGRLRVWDSSLELFDLELPVHQDEIHALVCTDEDATVFTVGADSRLYVTGLVTKSTKCVFEFGETPWSIASSADGRILFVGLDGRIAVIRRDEQLNCRYFGRRGGFVYGLAYSHAGRALFAAASDGFLSKWAVGADGELTFLRRVEAHDDACNAVAISATAEYIGTSGADGSIKLWSASTLAEAAAYRPPLPYAGLRLRRGQVSSAHKEELERLGARFEER